MVLSSLTVRDCGGHADGRGALWITNGAMPTIVNVSFERNRAELRKKQEGVLNDLAANLPIWKFCECNHRALAAVKRRWAGRGVN